MLDALRELQAGIAGFEDAEDGTDAFRAAERLLVEVGDGQPCWVLPELRYLDQAQKWVSRAVTELRSHQTGNAVIHAREAVASLNKLRALQDGLRTIGNTMTPQRIQRKRTKGWRMPEGAVYVGRPTKWGNPVRIVPVHRAGPFDLERDGVGFVGQHTGLHSARWSAARRFRDLVNLGLLAPSIADIRSTLRGHDLCCWCPLDQPCHADVLLELANVSATPVLNPLPVHT